MNTLLVMTAVTFSSPAFSDLLPPSAASARERLRHSGVIDRVDQYCAGKRAKEACVLPGNAFEGGGEGICRREANDTLGKVDLTCRQKATVEIDHGFGTDARFFAGPGFCGIQNDEKVRATLAHGAVTCTQPQGAAQDRFCRGKVEGDVCSADVLVDGKPMTFQGQCTQRTESMRFYLYGYNEAERLVLACAPRRPEPKREYKPVGFFRGLFR